MPHWLGLTYSFWSSPTFVAVCCLACLGCASLLLMRNHSDILAAPLRSTAILDLDDNLFVVTHRVAMCARFAKRASLVALHCCATCEGTQVRIPNNSCPLWECIVDGFVFSASVSIAWDQKPVICTCKSVLHSIVCMLHIVKCFQSILVPVKLARCDFWR